MAIEIPSSLVDFVLLGPEDDRRQLQDSPILGDVWIAFAKRPDVRLDLLITPYMTLPAGRVASVIEKIFDRINPNGDGDIAYLQGIVAARLDFEELLRVVIPMTKWWADKQGKNEKEKHELEKYDPAETKRVVGKVLRSAHKHFMKPEPAAKSRKKSPTDKPASGKGQRDKELMPLDRYVVLTGLILWARRQTSAKKTGLSPSEKVEELLTKAKDTAVAKELQDLFEKISSTTKEVQKLLLEAWNDGEEKKPLVWQVSLNRTAVPALGKSVPAVKADAAKFLFKVDCGEITWAVIDSGIAGDHPAFGKADGTGFRVKRSFDFRNFRKIVSLSNATEGTRKRNLERLLELPGLLLTTSDGGKSKKQLEDDLDELASDAKRRGAIHWDLVEPFVEIDPKMPPDSNHGTHVAGIIGASGKAADPTGTNSDIADGMCPDINLYDFRVLGPSLRDTEFAIIAVLQYIRYLNDRDNFFTIHGANLSLSIPHDVRNFACGRTPICNECERLSASGVIVVAAAGNHGYKSFETRDGAFDSYAAFSITDPGNADDVITVGATHRHWPHTYGVSFFSSRGPTGDGRLKPDLVAPGERIRAPLPGGEWGDLDGTSMAAPHVSGAAAMLLARYSELIGQPRRVKRILCDTATDLARERTFQGHGMLDVLRAFQSI